MAESQSTLTALAAKITEQTQELTTKLREANFPEPSFAVDSVSSYHGAPEELFLLRQSLLDSLMDMWYLTQGPTESIFNYTHSVMPDVACLTVLNRFDFWNAVSIDGSASYEEIAKKVSLPLRAVERLVEHAVTLRLFEYVPPGKSSGRVRHTSRSAAIANSPGLQGLVSCVMDDAGPPLALLPEALDRFSYGKEEVPVDVNKTAFKLLYSGGALGDYQTTWDRGEEDGEGEKKGWRARRFADFSVYLKELFQTEKLLDEVYDWKSAGKISVVDLGGSGGHDSFSLAQKYPDLQITVQDLPEQQYTFNKNIPAELKDRVKFMPHNFFNPQPIQADVFVIKLILHDWPNSESVSILRNLTPGMKPGSRLIFIDYAGKQDMKDEDEKAAVEEKPSEPAVELPRHMQNMGTATDLRMMALFAAEERPVSIWPKLIKEADSRYEVKRVEANPLTFMVIIEAEWTG